MVEIAPKALGAPVNIAVFIGATYGSSSVLLSSGPNVGVKNGPLRTVVGPSPLLALCVGYVVKPEITDDLAW